jgi:hypothetical protein
MADGKAKDFKLNRSSKHSLNLMCSEFVAAILKYLNFATFSEFNSSLYNSENKHF